jgi:hypothetical protein
MHAVSLRASHGACIAGRVSRNVSGGQGVKQAGFPGATHGSGVHAHRVSRIVTGRQGACTVLHTGSLGASQE